MQRRDIRYIYLSMFLHALPILAILLLGGGQGKDSESGSGGGTPVQVTILDREQEKKESGEQEAEVKVPKKKKQEESKPKEPDCENYYEGIGISVNWRNNVVFQVARGYPAESAGILIGDIVEPVGEPNIRGPIGSPVLLKITRNGEVFYRTVFRDKICTEKKP